VHVIGGQQVGNGDFLVELLLAQCQHYVLGDSGAGSDDK
jgi:hypothetical protein